MGDRRNIVVEFDSNVSVALYSHWTGEELDQVLANALDRARERWSDAPYLTRVIFSDMVKDALGSTTGYGIEPFATGTIDYTESEPHYDLVVSIANKTVTGDIHGEGKVRSFVEFIQEEKSA